MRILWILLGPLLVAASEHNGQGLRNYYTGKVSVGFENFDDDQPQLIPYAGEGVEGAPETDDSKILEYGTPVVHPRKHQRNSRELKRTSEEKRTRPRNPKPTRPPPLTTTTTTTEAPPFPVEEFATDGRAPPAPNEIPPELRAAFGSFGIGGGGDRPIFETKEASVEATTEEPITTTSSEMRIKKQRRKHRKYQMSNTVKPVVISVTTAPREIPPELRQVFGIEKPDIEKSLEKSRELFDDHFEQNKRLIVEKEYMKSASAEDKKEKDESDIADQIEKELAQKKRRRKYKKLRSTTTMATTMEASVSGEDEEWREVSNEEVEMRRQVEEEIVKQAEREKADARRLKAMEDERVRLVEQKAELEKEQAAREKAKEKRLKAMEEARILLEKERKAERERQQAEKAKERERIRLANEEKERERLEAEREKEEAKRLKEIEDERERQVNEKKAELERLQEAIRQKKEELKAQERIEKNLSMKEDEKSEQEDEQQNDADDVKSKALLKKRKGPGRGGQKKMRSKGEQRQQLPPIPDSMRVPETPMNHVEVEPPQFQRPQPLPQVEEEESFADKILSRAPNFATKITPHKDSGEKTKIHGLNTYNPMMEPEKEETEKQTGFATLKVFPVNEEEITEVDPNEATFKGSWETTTQSTTRVTKAKKSNKPRKEKKWSQETAREYYEQYYREWAANQTKTVTDSSEETTTLQSILLRGLKQRPRMMPNGEEAAPPTPVPRDFDTGAKPVPLMTAMYGAIPSGPQVLQGPLPAHQSTMPISRPIASNQPVAPSQPSQSSQSVPLKNLQLPSSFGGLGGATNPFQAMMGLGGGMGGMGALSGLVPPGLPATKGNMFGITDPRGGGHGDLTYQQLNQLCLSIKGVSRAFAIDDMKGFARTNCGLIASFYNDASCDQIQHVMDYCEAYFKDPEHKG
ncbi:unnamed protein product, partial [Mesorhabditis belari]|uniref:aECM cysteine-cradle domain-containing protein n=1 Tax=Mesorhabditis belari TaxID=2138241 RepID=A0AAF3EJJ9_9BILA